MASPIELGPLGGRLDDWDDISEDVTFPYITSLVEALLDRGHQVEVFALNRGITQPRQYLGDSLALNVLPMRALGRDRVRDNYRAERRHLNHAMHNSDCDLIHAHWTYEFGAAAVTSGKPTVVTAHDAPWSDIAVVRHLTLPESRAKRSVVVTKNASRAVPRALMAEYVVRRADIVTAVSPNVKRHLERWHFPRGPVQLIQNGLVPSGSLPRNGPKDATKPVYGFISNGFGDRKNSAGALRAFAIVRNSIPDARLILMGHGHEEGGPGHHWARDQGLDTNTEWRGPTPHRTVTSSIENDIDVVVHPSFWEACSIAIMEAQNAGVPVIGGIASGGVSYSLQDGAAGRLVDVHNPLAIAQAMTTLARDNSEYRRLSQNGLRAIVEYFNRDRVVDAYEAAYTRLISNSQRG